MRVCAVFFQVLCVGNLYNPDVRYSFNIPIEEHREQFVWDPSGSWLECSRVCQGMTAQTENFSFYNFNLKVFVGFLSYTNFIYICFVCVLHLSF